MRVRAVHLLLPALALHATLVAAQVTAIRAGRVVDPDAGTIAQNQVILVEGGKITAIGGSVRIPSGATVIDLSRSTISPGLVEGAVGLAQLPFNIDQRIVFRVAPGNVVPKPPDGKIKLIRHISSSVVKKFRPIQCSTDIKTQAATNSGKNMISTC